MSWPETKTVLVTVRTYPTPATKGVEVSCTAGITEDGRWIRLFPIPYRYLPTAQRFRKYQWIKAAVRRSSDSRPESYEIDVNSIQLLSEPLPERNAWEERKRHVLRLLAPSLCALKRAWQADKQGAATLGIFRPRRILRLRIEPTTPAWSPKQLAALRQYENALIPDPRTPRQELEKVPFNFKYVFQCDDDACKTHTLGCTDWEASEAWRSWRRYGSAWEQKFRQKFETWMTEKRDTHFYVGTVHEHPAEWMIVGLFYPPKHREQQPALPGLEAN